MAKDKVKSIDDQIKDKVKQEFNVDLELEQVIVKW